MVDLLEDLTALIAVSAFIFLIFHISSIIEAAVVISRVLV